MSETQGTARSGQPPETETEADWPVLDRDRWTEIDDANPPERRAVTG